MEHFLKCKMHGKETYGYVELNRGVKIYIYISVHRPHYKLAT